MGKSAQQDTSHAIAIIGMSCRLPGATNIEEYWRNLVGGVESISYFDEEQLRAAGVPVERYMDPSYVRANGIIGDADHFDAGFFGFNPRESEIMDPQHRVFMECAWHALENAGYDPGRAKERIGIFAGAGVTNHLVQLFSIPDIEQYASGLAIVSGNDKDYMTTRISHRFDLTGPSVDLQSACSTSLVAVVFGTTSLLNYQSDMVLAGGISLKVPEQFGYFFQEGGIESSDGHCRPFDASAGGTNFTNGAGCVVLKRLADAVEDGDHIYAVILGGAVNNDGANKVGYTAPSVDGQTALTMEALSIAGVSPDTIEYVETHGTGTQVGDPIEIAALQRAFRAYTQRRQFCRIGSVKSNIGHTDIAAGVAGLIKASLALEREQIPPSLHFNEANREIDFEQSPFLVNTELVDWKRGASARRAGVSAFGIGGTNAHVVLEEAPARRKARITRQSCVLPVSARSPEALSQLCEALAGSLESREAVSLHDAAYTLQVGRRQLTHRCAFVCDGRDEAMAALRSGTAGAEVSGICQESDRTVTFMFPGQGTQFPGMGRELYETEAVFRDVMDNAAELLMPALGLDLRELLFPQPQHLEAAAAKLNETRYTQPALFVVETALARQWMAWGFAPEAMIGHSIGEYVAACIAGVFSFEDALQLVALRGHLMQELPRGSMLAVLLPAEDVVPRLGDRVSLAAVNGPALSVVSGPTGDVEALGQELAGDGAVTQMLPTSHAFHSAMMDPILEQFAAAVGEVDRKPPGIPFVSNLTGTWIGAGEATDPHYWSDHLRQAVQFSKGMAELLQDPGRILLEVGPGRSLLNAARHHPDFQAGHAALGSMRQAQEAGGDVRAAFNALAGLWVAGAEVDWDAFHGDQRFNRVALPGYPFERQKYWLDPLASGAATKAVARPIHHDDVGNWFYTPTWERTGPPGTLPQREDATDAECWLVFLDDGPRFGGLLADALTRDEQQVVTVRAATGFAQRDERDFAIDPGEPEHYDVMLEILASTGRTPTHVAHLWNVTPERAKPDFTSSGADGRSGAEDIYLSLQYLSQALIKYEALSPLTVAIVSNGMQDVAGELVWAPEKAAVLGCCKVFPQEYTSVQCRSVDIVLPASEIEERRLARHLVEEIRASVDDTAVAYRGPHRWVQRSAAVNLKPPAGIPARLRSRGVYVITGGFGGIGLSLARHLATELDARLALVGRGDLPPVGDWPALLVSDPDSPLCDKIRAVRELERAGAEVLALSAAVTDAAGMAAAVEKTVSRFGAVHGVFHSAGIAGGGVIPLKTKEAALAVLEPKMRGTVVAAEAFDELDLDFFVIFSSITAMLGDVGQIDYCAANAFIDGYVRARQTSGDGRFGSVNWGTWDVVGMAVNARNNAAGPALQRRTSKPVEHPLLRREVAAGGEEFFTTEPAGHWVMDEHRLAGNPTLVGTAYIEMIAGAARHRWPGRVPEIRDLFFLAPFMEMDAEIPSRELKLFVREDDGGWQVSFRSSPSGAQGTEQLEHATASVMPMADDSAEPQPVSLPELQQRCDQGIDERRFDQPMLERDPQRSIVFGEQWNALRRVHRGAGEALAEIELPEVCCGEAGQFVAHPAIVDVATAFALRFVSEELFLPIHYGNIRLYRPVPRHILCHARYPDDQEDRDVLSIDLTVLSEDGEVVAEIDRFTMKRVPESFLSTDPSELFAQSAQRPASGAVAPLDAGTASAERGIKPQEGVDALVRWLDRDDLPQIIIEPTDFDYRIQQSLPTAEPADAAESLDSALGRASYPRPAIATPFVAPRDELETVIAEIWKGVIGIQEVGVHDDFIELGGHSLLAIQVMTHIREHLEVNLPLAAIYETPTVEGLARTVLEVMTELVGEDTFEALLEEVETASAVGD